MSHLGRSLVLIAMPTMLFAAGMASGRAAVDASTRITPEPKSLLEAVDMGASTAILGFVTAGEDPGQAVVLTEPTMQRKRGDVISPLLLAIARSDREQVAYLARHAKHIEVPPNDQALCVAAEYGRDDIIKMLFGFRLARVPERGCDGSGKQPEEVAKEAGHDGVAKHIEQYRSKS